MISCMRTTILLDDNLLAALRKIAAASGRTLTAVIHDAIRESLARREDAPPQPVELPIFRGTGLLPGVDLHDSAALLDRMERHDGPA